MRKILLALLTAGVVLLPVGLFNAAPAAATTASGTFACPGVLYSYTVDYTRYQGSGGLRSRVNSIHLTVASTGGTPQHEYRARVMSSAGTAWDGNYQVSGPLGSGHLIVAYIFGSNPPNQLVANGARVLLQAGIYGDGYAACDQNVYI